MSSSISLTTCNPAQAADFICSFDREMQSLEKVNSVALASFKGRKDDPRRAELLADRAKIQNYKDVFAYLYQLLEIPLDEENPTQVVVYETDREIKGMASFYIDHENHELFIETILKAPKFLLETTSKGIGKEILYFLINTARAHHLAKVTLSPTEGSYGFYEKIGMDYDEEKNKFSFLIPT